MNSVPAPLIYTSSTQVAAVVPYAVNGAEATVQVTYNGNALAPVYDAMSGHLTRHLHHRRRRQAAAVNQDGSRSTAPRTRPTHPNANGILSLYMTGGGPTNPGGQDGLVRAMPLPSRRCCR